MTIVILIILATISINAIFGEDGVIRQAEIAKVQMKQAEYEEKTKLIVSGEYLGKKIDPELASTALKELSKNTIENEEWVKTVEDVEDEENQIRVITTDNYLIVAEILEDGNTNIIQIGPDNGEPYPTLVLEQEALEGTANEKVKIKVVATVETTDKTNKISTVKIVSPENQKVEKEYTDGGVIFEVEGNGKYTFEATTNMSKSSRKSITLNVVEPESSIEITSTPTTPRNTTSVGTQNGIAKGPITVTINYGETNFKKQYKKTGDSTWTEVTGTSATFTVTDNIAIYARYYDTKNGGLKSVTYNIQNIDNVAPNAFNATETHTTNSITVGASTTDTASSGAASTTAGILRYEYRIYKNSAWQGWQTSNNFTGLPTGSYQVQAKAIDKAGNEKVSTNTLNITLGTVSTADISITSTPTTARNTGTTGTQNGIAKGPISVTITYGNSSYTRQYKKSTDSTWTTVTGTTTFTVTNNIAIYARYFDGTNGFQTQAYNIQNVDNVAPTFSTYNATVSGATITASGTATDTATTGAASTIPGILRYEYSNGGTTYQTSNKFIVSSAGTYTIYIKAIDKAGNQTIVNKQVTVNSYTVTYNANGGSGAPAAQTQISGVNLTLSSTVPTRTGYSFLGWGTSSTATSATYAKGATYTANTTATLYAVWKLDNTAPTAPTTSVTARDTSSFTVNAKSTDSNGDSLTYKLYAKTSTGSYALAATSASTASGTAVNLKASSLSGYTVYNYYVTVTDGKATTTGTTGTTGTACSGATLTCANTTSYTCSATTTIGCTGGTVTSSSTGGSTCGICGNNSSVSVTWKCSACGKTWGDSGCQNNACSNYDPITPPSFEHTIYYCSKHGYKGTSKSHTASYDSTTIQSCSGATTTTCKEGVATGESESFHPTGAPSNVTVTLYTYYCSKHNITYKNTAIGHNVMENCAHGYSSSHYYCTTHGYVGTASTHTYCSHGKTSTHYPN